VQRQAREHAPPQTQPRLVTRVFSRTPQTIPPTSLYFCPRRGNPELDANSRDGVARIKSWTYDISVGACSVVRPDGVFVGWANDFAGGANDFAGGANDFAGGANDFAGGANDFAGRVILCA
jgi:hypothetical protein